jgi:hypothetical protein
MDPAFSEQALEGVKTELQSIRELIDVEHLSEFVHLQRLPVELQVKIWKYAVPHTLYTRVVSIMPRVKGNQLPSGLLHLCSSSRSEYRKHYDRIESKSAKFAFFIKYDLDTLDINQYNSGARLFRRFNPPLPVLMSAIHIDIPQLKLDKVQKLVIMVESRAIGPFPLPSYATNVSRRFQMEDGESFWKMIEKSFPNLSSIRFILNKVKEADLRKLVRLEAPKYMHHGPTLRNALLDLMRDVRNEFLSQTSDFTKRDSYGFWSEMGFDCAVFEDEKQMYLGGPSIPDCSSWV